MLKLEQFQKNSRGIPKGHIFKYRHFCFEDQDSIFKTCFLNNLNEIHLTVYNHIFFILLNIKDLNYGDIYKNQKYCTFINRTLWIYGNTK
jgi:hypothetical protein